MLKHAIANNVGIPVEANTDHGEPVGLVVATRPNKLYDSRTMFFLDGTGNVEMAQPAIYGDTPEKVHDGLDNVYWTGVVRSGNWTLNDTGTITDHTPADSGDHCIEAINTVAANAQIQFNHASSIDLTPYEAITGWIYITGWAAGDLQIRGRLNGNNMGPWTNINDYIDTGLQNVWQRFTIPLIDALLNGDTIDSFRIRNRIGTSRFYLDDIQIEQTGTTYKAYHLHPDVGTNLHVQKIRTTYVALLDMDHQYATVPFLSYNNILGVTLTHGWLYQRIQDHVVKSAQIVKSLHDSVFTGVNIVDVVCDGTNTMVTAEYIYPVPEILKAEDLDFLKVQMQDPNMDDFISMRMCALGFQETIN